MSIQLAEYVGSFPTVSKCPTDVKPEYAFIGRSNVGKSSLINALTAKKDLAHTSKKPGKTQSINYFIIDKTWYLVDLPGYGYAKVSQKKRHEWRKMIEGYLLRRETLQCAFLLLDLNVPTQKIDLEFINWMGQMGVPFALVFTKVDRMKKDQIGGALKAYQDVLLEHWEELPPQYITSSRNREGLEAIEALIVDTNSRFNKEYYD